jgi:hypothetical protein
MKKSRLFIPLIGLAFIATGFNFEDPNGQAGAAGSPSESTCSRSGCHTGSTDNSEGGSVTVSSSNLTNWEYVPGTTYNISVTVAEAGISTWGFATEILKANGDNAGTLIAGSGTHILTANVGGFSRRSVTQTSAGSGANSKTYNFTWTAPATDVGPVTIYAVGNAANGDGGRQGDHIYSTSQVVNPATSNGVAETSNIQMELGVYPNPTADLINLDYALPLNARVKASVFTTDGRLVKTMFEANQAAGFNHKTFDVSDLASGFYFVNVEVDGKFQSPKMFEKK